MHKLVIMIEPLDDWQAFEEGWPQFLHLVERMPGLRREATSRVEAFLYGRGAYAMVHELFFDALPAAQQAMASPEGREAGRLLQEMTGGRMALFFAEHKEDELENIQRHQPAQATLKSALGPEDVQAFMAANSIPGEILFLEVPTPTVETAAQAVGTQPDQILKSILFLVKEQAVLAITCGTQPVERRAIAELYGVGRKQVKLTPPEAVLEIAGYEVGAMPPFAHRQSLTTLIDPRVLEHQVVYAGGGAENALLRISPQEILRGVHARVVDLTPAAVTPETETRKDLPT